MKPYAPESTIHYNPNERPLLPEEATIVRFLEAGLKATLENLVQARDGHHYGTVSDCQIQAQTLRNAIDGIRAGLHDVDHPTRVIEVKAAAEKLFHRW